MKSDKNQKTLVVLTTSTVDGLHVCHFNANSLRIRIENLRLFTSVKLLFHIIVVSETKLAAHIPDSLVQLENYPLHRCDWRSDGGEVALYIYKFIEAKIICKSTFNWTQ